MEVALHRFASRQTSALCAIRQRKDLSRNLLLCKPIVCLQGLLLGTLGSALGLIFPLRAFRQGDSSEMVGLSREKVRVQSIGFNLASSHPTLPEHDALF